ncbi:MAG: UTP--glucose-1-phosphate uridylyltransferase [Candidatus Nealsonbacteria bacterium]|nr:UTP--glucose-1-phosphate uridylyltransferase [Candidatus Nealsonbacteria bacterium]
MTHELIDIITSDRQEVRNQSLEAFCRNASAEDLLDACQCLDRFRLDSENLYQRVRALFFLSAIYRYHLPDRLPARAHSLLPYRGYTLLLNRRFDEAIDDFLASQQREGPNDTIASALAVAYHELGFQTLANQVRQSVRSTVGNRWMFRTGHPGDHPLRIRRELVRRRCDDAPFPILMEQTPVRMDLSHSAWSDIFFLGMDFPEGARVLNVSVDLGVRGRDPRPRPPIEAYLRVIDEPVLRLVSVDLKSQADVTSLAEVFDYAKDYLGLLKAAVIASGIVPPGLEGSQQSLVHVLERVVGPGLGLELVSKVNDIPKGSRLAVSTNLLAALISVCMRATGQAKSLTGQLGEQERRVVAARAILGEWLAGSGGGWQDSGGVWPGEKMIEGRIAADGDPEWGVSRGRLLPEHRIYTPDEVSEQTRQKIHDSFVLVHGGMAQDVGPVLEMVTEKYLLRSEKEWHGRRDAIELLKSIEGALHGGDVRELASLTTQNFASPIQAIIPWATNHYTETLIQRARAKFGDAFWGFLMLGGMSGGGMGFIFDPKHKPRAQDYMQELMSSTKHELQHALPFAMEPVVYDFAVNHSGTTATWLDGNNALMPAGYYALVASQWLRTDVHKLAPACRAEIARFAATCRTHDRLEGSVDMLFSGLFPQADAEESGSDKLKSLLTENGFDPELHEQIRSDLRAGRIGLAQNRLPSSTVIEDIHDSDVAEADEAIDADCRRLGEAALANGKVAVVTLAAGAGSRWTQGAGVVKALNPFFAFDGRYRNFIEVHLAKSRRASMQHGAEVPHVVTTSFLTHGPVEQSLGEHDHYGYSGPLALSRGRSVGLRMVPMPRDLRFAWEEMPQQLLDEQAQKVRESLHAALINWAEQAGPGNDYTDNLPLQCLHPVGHWFEVPNLLRNGTLAGLLRQRPQLDTLLLHNIDTLGADLNPGLLGLHLRNDACLTFEVIGRRIEDRGGGLARINGQVRLLESLALPREEDEFKLTYYNSMTTWINVDKLLGAFGLGREDLADEAKVTAAIRQMSLRMPTYVTLKDVKKRWGHGQEDVFPVAQFEKLWGDMTALPEVDCRFVVVPRMRGQQLKEPAQLDPWLRDGSAKYVDELCEWA